MHFLALFFVLLSTIVHVVDHFNQAFLNSFSEFGQQFLFFTAEYLLNLRLLYSAIYIWFKTLLLLLLQILTQFLLIVPKYCMVLFLYHDFLQQILEILFTELLLDQHLKLFVCLDQLQLVCNDL